MNEILAAMDTGKCDLFRKQLFHFPFNVFYRAFEYELGCFNDMDIVVLQSDHFNDSSFRLILSVALQGNGFLPNSISVLMTVVSFGLFTLLGGDLTPAKAFTSLSLWCFFSPYSCFPILLRRKISFMYPCLSIQCNSVLTGIFGSR